jgi:hypothetical protein
MYQLIDFINPQGNIALTEKLDKIEFNIGQVEPFRQNVLEQRKKNKNGVICMAPMGRWIVIYREDIKSGNNICMYFIDFNVDTGNLADLNIFSENVLLTISRMQNEYFDKVYNETHNNVELIFAEPYEKVVLPNLFSCDSDEKVLAKAKELGALPIISTLKEGDRVKVALVDEKITSEDKIITNVYALIHFGGHEEERKHDNGFAYIKLFDLMNNLDRVIDFQNAIEGAGGKFDRVFFIEKFTNGRLN